jgi:hypothetical protein
MDELNHAVTHSLPGIIACIESCLVDSRQFTLIYILKMLRFKRMGEVRKCKSMYGGYAGIYIKSGLGTSTGRLADNSSQLVVAPLPEHLPALDRRKHSLPINQIVLETPLELLAVA